MKRFPALNVTFAFTGGILLHYFYSFSPLQIAAVFIGLVILILFTFLLRKPLNNPVNVFVLYLLILQAGNFNASVNREQMNLLPPEIIKQPGFTVNGRIEDVNLIRQDRISFIIKADSIHYDSVLYKGCIKLVGELRIEQPAVRDSVYEVIYPGQQIQLSGLFVKGRETRNPGEFDYNKYLRDRNISGILRSTFPDDLLTLTGKRDALKSLIFSWRKNIDERIKELHTPETASLLRGLLLADRSGIDYSVRDAFINTGVMHVLAVSGLHTAYIILIFLIIFGRFNLISRSLFTIAGLIFFLLITGMQVSVLRSVIMSVLITAALLSNRSTNIFNSLAVAALTILIITPGEIYDPGFQLSFTAVLAIALIYPVIRDILPARLNAHPYLKSFILFVSVSLAAQIGTLPITIFYFDKLSLIAIAANIIVIPLGGVIIANSAVTLILSLFVPLIPSLYAAANELFTMMMYRSVELAAGVPGGFLWVNNFSTADIIIAYAFIGFFFLILKRTRLSGGTIISFLILFNMILFTTFNDKDILSPGKLSVMMIDVGQGDAFLIGTPQGKTILIDAGQADKFIDKGDQVILPFLNHLNIKLIDYAFITHLDLDHYGGIVSLIYNKKIKHLLKPPPDYSTEDDKLENFLKKTGQSFSYYDNGIMVIDELRFYILNDYRNNRSLSGNDASGVFKLTYGNTSFLFTGDIHTAGENYYINRYGNFLSSNVLKVSHHGSKSSTSGNFIKFTRPDFALISSGYKNRFKHPSKEVIERLVLAGTKIFRTDSAGAVLIQSDGNKVHQNGWNN